MGTNLDRLILEALHKIKKDGPKFKDCGICENVRFLMPPGFKWDAHESLHDYFECSGLDMRYPVPSPDPERSNFDFYVLNRHLIWDTSHPYGRARRNLLNELIAEYTARCGAAVAA